MTRLLEAISRRLHPSDASEELDVDTAAKEHHDRLMGHNLSLEERRDRAGNLGMKRAPARPERLAG